MSISFWLAQVKKNFVRKAIWIQSTYEFENMKSLEARWFFGEMELNNKTCLSTLEISIAKICKLFQPSILLRVDLFFNGVAAKYRPYTIRNPIMQRSWNKQILQWRIFGLISAVLDWFLKINECPFSIKRNSFELIWFFSTM